MRLPPTNHLQPEPLAEVGTPREPTWTSSRSSLGTPDRQFRATRIQFRTPLGTSDLQFRVVSPTSSHAPSPTGTIKGQYPATHRQRHRQQQQPKQQRPSRQSAAPRLYRTQIPNPRPRGGTLRVAGFNRSATPATYTTRTSHSRPRKGETPLPMTKWSLSATEWQLLLQLAHPAGITPHHLHQTRVQLRTPLGTSDQ